MKATDWIKVTDKLPEEGEWVLIHFGYGRMYLGVRYGNKWSANWNEYDLNLATHWTPVTLPGEELI